MTDITAAQAELERATEARVEKLRLTERLTAGEDYLRVASQQVSELRTELLVESEDVERLESFSPSRIWASLKGSRDTDLDRESTEVERARFAVAEAEAESRRDAARRDCDAAQAQLDALGDVDAQHARALAAAAPRPPEAKTPRWATA